jgi:hypothetical protein
MGFTYKKKYMGFNSSTIIYIVFGPKDNEHATAAAFIHINRFFFFFGF